MTTECRFLVTDSTGLVEITYASQHDSEPGKITDPITLNAVNTSLTVDCSSVIVNVCRGDMLIDGPAGEDAESAQAAGSELLAEQWLEGRKGTSGAWVPIDEWAAGGIDLGAISAGDSQAFQVRYNIPADAETIGEINICLRIDARN